MFISVIIPVYKPKDYLWACLKSIKNQTFDSKLFEVIIVLNGPKDPYQHIINNFINKELKENKVVFIYSEVAGVSNARNLGLDICRGKYIAFIDDDDYISPSYLEEMYNIAILGKMPLSNMIAFDDLTNKNHDSHYIHKMFINQSKKGDRSKIQVRSYFSSPCAKLISIEFIGNRRFNTNFKNGEDGLFMYSISDKIKKNGFTTEKAVYYRRIREGSAVNLYRNKGTIVINSLRLISEIIYIYFSNFLKYSFVFTFYRILAEIFSVCSILFLKNNK